VSRSQAEAFRRTIPPCSWTTAGSNAAGTDPQVFTHYSPFNVSCPCRNGPQGRYSSLFNATLVMAEKESLQSHDLPSLRESPNKLFHSPRNTPEPKFRYAECSVGKLPQNLNTASCFGLSSYSPPEGSIQASVFFHTSPEIESRGDPSPILKEASSQHPIEYTSFASWPLSP